jgi:hypothetical protein
VTKDGVIYGFLVYNIIGIQKQLTGIASLSKGMSGKNSPIIDSTNCINKAVLYSGNNNVDYISEGVLDSIDRQIKINVDPCSM